MEIKTKFNLGERVWIAEQGYNVVYGFVQKIETIIEGKQECEVSYLISAGEKGQGNLRTFKENDLFENQDEAVNYVLDKVKEQNSDKYPARPI